MNQFIIGGKVELKLSSVHTATQLKQRPVVSSPPEIYFI